MNVFLQCEFWVMHGHCDNTTVFIERSMTADAVRGRRDA